MQISVSRLNKRTQGLRASLYPTEKFPLAKRYFMLNSTPSQNLQLIRMIRKVLKLIQVVGLVSLTQLVRWFLLCACVKELHHEVHEQGNSQLPNNEVNKNISLLSDFRRFKTVLNVFVSLRPKIYNVSIFFIFESTL